MLRLLCLTLAGAALAVAQPAAGLSGRVVDLRGMPVIKVALQLKPLSNAPDADPRAWHVQSGTDGEFLFEGIDPGAYTLSAAKAGYLAFNFGATKINPSARPIHLVAGKQLEGMTVQMTLAAAISGKVLDDDGEPARAYITVSKDRYEDGVRKLVQVMSGYAEVDGDGRYRISGLETGRYYVRAYPPGPSIPFQFGGSATVNGAFFVAVPVNAAARPGTPKSEYTATFYPSAIDQRDAKAIEIVAGQELSGIDIRLRKYDVFSIRGKIDGVIPGHPADEYRVILNSPGRTAGVMGPLPANVRADGSFEITGIPSGEYDLSVAPGGLGKTPLAVQRMAVRNDAEGIVFSLRAPGSISGSIVGQDEKPFPGVSVSLIPVAGPAIRIKGGPAKEGGLFHLADIPPGHYRVTVSGHPEGTYLATDSVLEIAPGAALDQVRLVLGPAGRIQGSASARDTITVIPDPQRPDRPEWYKQAAAGDDGRFELIGVTPGTYRVFAWSDIEPGEWFDSEFLKPHLNQSVPVIVREGMAASIELTEIPAQ